MIPEEYIRFPVDFPRSHFVRLDQCVRQRAQEGQRAQGGIMPSWYQQFLPSWTGVLYRYRACADYDEAYRRDFVQLDGRASEAVYQREQNLFGFFLNGQSSLECFCYSLYAVGYALDEKHFHLMRYPRDQRKITPRASATALRERFPRTALALALVEMFGVDGTRRLPANFMYTRWEGFRNILVHRMAPFCPNTKIVFCSNGREEYYWQMPDGTPVPLGPDTTAEHRVWLATVLDDLLQKTEAFLNDCF